MFGIHLFNHEEKAPGFTGWNKIQKRRNIEAQLKCPVLRQRIISLQGMISSLKIENRKISIQKDEDTVSENAILQINFFPNPATELLNVEISGMAYGAAMSMEVYDAMGVMVEKTDFVNEGVNSILLDEISNGVYFCKLINGGIVISKNKIVIVK